MSFSVIVSIIIIIVAVSAAASFVLRDNEGRIKPALAVLSLVLAGFAAVLYAYGSENGTVYAKADGDPQATVRQFFDAVCAGDYSSAYDCLENYGSLGLENSPSTETGELVYAALRESYAYELLEQAEVDKLSARQRVSFTYLNLPAMEEDAAAETEKVLETLVRSRPRNQRAEKYRQLPHYRGADSNARLCRRPLAHKRGQRPARRPDGRRGMNEARGYFP